MAAPAKKKELDTFSYEAVDSRGKKLKGELKAASLEAAKVELRRQGITPQKLKKKAKPLFESKGKIETVEIAIFARQLATMMEAGVPLVQAFDIVGRGSENPAMMNLILGIKADIESGTPLADALHKQPQYFDDLFCNLVSAGEAAGVLETMLDKIATYKEKSESMKKKIKKALTYPIAVVVVAIVVTMVIMIFVIPQFEELFSSFGANLPAFTQMVVNASRFMQANWWIVFGIVGGIGYAFSFAYKRSQAMREGMDRMLLKFPIIGEIMNKASIARFARTLSTMFAAGVPMVDALQSVAGATGNIVYSNAVMQMREDVATGTALQATMKQQDVFPNMVIQMVSIGEESGALDAMLGKVADFYEEEVDNLVDALSSLMEPMIMAILGVLVGGLVVAMYLPIFSMGSVV